MPRYQSPSTRDQRSAFNSTGQVSDAILFGITRGASGLSGRDPGSAAKHHYIPTDTFENTYPRYEFSTLVELSLAVVRWLVRMRNKQSATAHQSQLEASQGKAPNRANAIRHDRAGWRLRKSTAQPFAGS